MTFITSLFQCRGWGAEIDPDYHRKQKELWDQVSRRSSLAALSLAATAVRPIGSKDQKDSTKGLSSTDAAAALKLRKEAVRHHLDRTTGSSESALLSTSRVEGN